MENTFYMDEVTRLTVVDHSKNGQGRVFEKWNIRVTLDLQDDGRTLKVFVDDRKDEDEAIKNDTSTDD